MSDDFGKYVNYPTYPGFGPWTLTTYEAGISGDYRIAETNIPTGQFADKLEIFSDSYDAGGWLGPIIPVPSMLFTGIPYTTILTFRGSYRNWLNTGRSVLITTPDGGDTVGNRPPTYHYQVLDKYKEVVHYGFDMLMLALVNALGQVRILRVDSLLPYLEHRHQGAFEQSVIIQERISSAEVQRGTNEIVVVPQYLGDVSVRPQDGLSISAKVWVPPVKETEEGGGTSSELGWEEYETMELTVVKSDADGRLTADGTPFADAINSGTFPDLAGGFLQLETAIQIRDPAMLYSEMDRNGTYFQETKLGFETREQSVSNSADAYRGIYYDASLISATIESERVSLLDSIEISDDIEQVRQGQQLFLELTAQQYAVESKEAIFGTLSEAGNGEEATVEVGTFDEEAAKLRERETQQAGGEETQQEAADEEGGGSGTDTTVRLDAAVLAQMKALESLTLYLRADIDGATLSKNNFHAGTQAGNYLLAEVDGALSAYRIASHPRNEIFQLVADSATSTLNLFDLLLEYEQQNLSVRSDRFWNVVDIMTNLSSANPSFTAGWMSNEIVAVRKEVLDDAGEPLPVEGGGLARSVVTVRLRDDNYYSRGELLRWLEDPVAEIVVKAWKKYDGWRFQKLGAEFSRSYSILDIRSGAEDEEFEIVLTDTLADADEIAEAEKGRAWWIGFAPPVPSSDTRLSYTGTPFFWLTAALSTKSEETGGDTIAFDGTYVGSPLSVDLQENAVLSLVEDNPVIFPNAGGGPNFSLIKVSSVRAFKYLAYSEDDARDTEFVLYSRDDDVSNALYVRQGRLDWLYDLDERLVYIGDIEWVRGEKISGDGASPQIVRVSEADLGNRDVVALGVRKDIHGERPASIEGSWLNTLWHLYHGDRLMGFRSTTGRENSIYTRAANLGVRAGIKEMPFYQNAEYFAEDRLVTYEVAGNRQTGDPDVGTGNRFTFLPVFQRNAKHASFAEAVLFETAAENAVVREAESQAIFPWIGGQRIVLAVQPQSFFAEGDSGVFEIVSGTESGKAKFDASPDEEIELAERGVFLMTTADNFRTYSGGIFSRPTTPPASTAVSKNALYRFPHLLVPNISNCAYAMSGGLLDVVGYSKMRDSSDNEVLALVHYSVNLEKTFNVPAFAYNVGGDIAFTMSDVRFGPNVVLRNATTDEIDGGVLYEGLEAEPLSLATSDTVKILFFQAGARFECAICMDDGERWSYYDDIEFVRDGARAAAPSAGIVGDELYLFYVVDRAALYFKRISVPNLAKFHRRYIDGKKSSGETDEAVNKLKQEFQLLLDNTESVKVADTFEQKVAFGVNKRGLVHVVYFDSDGLVNAADSSTEGVEWNSSPVNF